MSTYTGVKIPMITMVHGGYVPDPALGVYIRAPSAVTLYYQATDNSYGSVTSLSNLPVGAVVLRVIFS